MNDNKQRCKTYSNSDFEWDATKEIPDEETAMAVAKLCLASVTCDNCNLCMMFCPDLCITRSKETGKIEVDYDYCKGCGICAFICPKKVIDMVRE